MCLVALYVGLLPECASEADLAEHLGVDPAALSRSKRLLPPELQGFCHLHHRPRKLHSPQLSKSEERLDFIGDWRRHGGPGCNWIAFIEHK